MNIDEMLRQQEEGCGYGFSNLDSKLKPACKYRYKRGWFSDVYRRLLSLFGFI